MHRRRWKRDAEAERRALQEYVPGELITVPVITDGAVQGYFLTKLSFSVDKAKAKNMDVPFKQSVTNALFDILVGQKLINVADTSNFDLASFKTIVKDQLNKQLRTRSFSRFWSNSLNICRRLTLPELPTRRMKNSAGLCLSSTRMAEVAHDEMPESEKRAAAGH
ncbi:hypothetical protein LP421_15350 [Rhizobium sp. RCAM05350]|nr:hypothetical protein LP421_15350 [Rhizobium sp. RCAM05350]